MVFAGPLRNYIQDSDVLIAISSSGDSENIIRAVDLARAHKIPVIGISGFGGGRLNALSDAKILIPTAPGEYELVDHVLLLQRERERLYAAARSAVDSIRPKS